MTQLEHINEEAILFGRHQNLIGVWTDAIDDGRRETNTAVIMLTAGMIHHSGPFRLHVELAERLQSGGVPSLRFDLSGIGESLAVGASGRSLDRAADEISQAIDFLASRYGIEHVILFGLCSGADDAIHAATCDNRVHGVIAMDGCGYRTPTFYLNRIQHHYLPRVFKLSKWRRRVARLMSGWTSRSSGQEDSVPRSLAFGADIREFPSQAIAQSQLMSLAQRNTQLHFIYTGGVSDYYNHAAQFDAMFPELVRTPQISHCYFPEMDHVAFLCEDREQLIEHVALRVANMLNPSR